MPSSTFRSKISKSLGREAKTLRRASAQASPALRSKDPNPRSETAPQRPVSSHDGIAKSADNLPVHGEMKNLMGCDVCGDGGVSAMRCAAELCTPNLSQRHMQAAALRTSNVEKREEPKRASLLGIPVELRMMIFEFVLQPNERRRNTETTLYCAPTLRMLGPSHSQVCRVNRQIYEETKELLYGQTLVFLSREAMMSFSATRTPQQLSQVRSICMKPRSTDWVCAVKTLELPPEASLTVHWPIERELWQALRSNITLDYRRVKLVCSYQGHAVVFEPYTNQNAVVPTYQGLVSEFSAKK